MLFKKDIEPRCAYCAHGTQLEGDSILCKKKGVVHSGGHCRSFRYDPLLRVPPPPATLDLSRLKDEDFSL
ncbi:MAG TPA: hypothetical protein H9714_07405 [Candidatus Flavonifractor intestinipullorum]|uniref:Uncharacterized protein n=1 Tax=Candidatus Flavonifractor intestinipullorum TaxID=2838587 RepID=A0A9D2S6K2_9FIRM|nr:hypothetical protein [Candidatus Flavonifractor intestinipullorum]